MFTGGRALWPITVKKLAFTQRQNHSERLSRMTGEFLLLLTTLQAVRLRDKATSHVTLTANTGPTWPN